MATFKYSELLEGGMPELFVLFMREALKPFDNLVAGYIGSKHSYEHQGMSVETEVTGYQATGSYQVTVHMPEQEYVMTYTFTPREIGKVKVDYEEVFHTKKPVLAINHWIMSHLMKKSLQMKISRVLTTLQKD